MSRESALAGLAAVVLVLLAPTSVRAECTYPLLPPATEAAGSARELIVGTVVKNVDGQLYDFELRVDVVLRGRAHEGDVRRFSYVYPGWPPQRNADGTVALGDDGKPFLPCSAIPAWKGDVIVLALGALASDGKTRYNAVSWISGDLPFEIDRTTTTLDEMRRLAGLPDTATAAAEAVGIQPPSDSGRVLFLGSGFGIALAFAWRRSRRPQAVVVVGSDLQHPSSSTGPALS